MQEFCCWSSLPAVKMYLMKLLSISLPRKMRIRHSRASRQGVTGLHFSVRQRWFYGTDQDAGAIMKGLGTDIAYHGEDPNSTRFCAIM